MSEIFKMEGFDDLQKQLDELVVDAKEKGQKVNKDRIWRNAMKWAMEPVLEDAKSYAPKDSGQLAERIYMKVHRPMTRDKAGRYYDGETYLARVTSSPIRDDSVLNTVLNKKGKFQSVWSNKRPVGISQEFGNARNAAKPFLRPALEGNISRVTSRLQWSVWNAIQTLISKKG